MKDVTKALMTIDKLDLVINCIRYSQLRRREFNTNSFWARRTMLSDTTLILRCLHRAHLWLIWGFERCCEIISSSFPRSLMIILTFVIACSYHLHAKQQTIDGMWGVAVSGWAGELESVCLNGCWVSGQAQLVQLTARATGSETERWVALVTSVVMPELRVAWLYCATVLCSLVGLPDWLA